MYCILRKTYDSHIWTYLNLNLYALHPSCTLCILHTHDVSTRWRMLNLKIESKKYLKRYCFSECENERGPEFSHENQRRANARDRSGAQECGLGATFFFLSLSLSKDFFASLLRRILMCERWRWRKRGALQNGKDAWAVFSVSEKLTSFAFLEIFAGQNMIEDNVNTPKCAMFSKLCRVVT